MDTNLPKYMLIYSQLKSKIFSGEYAVGTFLPTENELVKQYEASKTTVRHAIALLKEDNMLNVQQGRGAEILPLRSHPIAVQRYRNANDIFARYQPDSKEENAQTSVPIIDMVPAEITIAQALQIKIGTQVYRIQRLSMHNNVPCFYTVNYVRCDFTPALEKCRGFSSSLYAYLEDTYDLHFSCGEESVGAKNAGFMESQYLNVEIGSPLLFMTRISHCDKGPLEYAETIARPDHFQIVIKLNNNAAKAFI